MSVLRIIKRIPLLLSLVLMALIATAAVGEEDTTTTATTAEEGEVKKPKFKIDPKLLEPDADWGTFYDPKDIFCGKFDCYKILGFDYFTFYKSPPTKKEITQNYRALSRHWHPDKNRSKGAKARFVKIARAYEVLTNNETRKEYDLYRERPDAYFQKYGSSVMFTYAPKSDTVGVVVALLALFSWISLWIKKHKWQQVANHVTKAAMENWGLREGGSDESISIRKKAMEILEERREAEVAPANGNGDSPMTYAKALKKKKRGLDKKEEKEADEKELKEIIKTLVAEIPDFGGGYAKPTWKDMFVVSLVCAPFYMAVSVAWWSKYLVRRISRLDYNEAELEYFTKRAIGGILWDTLTDDEKKEAISKELWVQDNLDEWKEQEELKLLSPKEQKMVAREKKREKRTGIKAEKEL